MIPQDASAHRQLSKRKINDNSVFKTWLEHQARVDDDGSVEAPAAPAEAISDAAAEISALMITPREYQNELFERAKEKNTIVVLDTGSGKTLIAIMLLRHVLEQELEDRSRGSLRKTAFFIVDKVALCLQQFQVIRANLPFPATKFYGDVQPIAQVQRHWDAQFDEHMIIVCTAQILLDCLSHGFISMRQINLLIFDEVHHAKKEHPYAAIMKRYYPRGDAVKPRILGLTASPIDTGTLDMEAAVQQLESLMCSEIATVSDDVLEAGWVKREQKERVRFYKPLRAPVDSYTRLTLTINDHSQHLPQLNDAVAWAVDMGSILGPWCADRFWQVLLTDDAMKNMALHSAKSNRVEFNYDRFEAASAALDTLRPMIGNHEFMALPTDDGAISSKLAVLRETLCAAFEENRATQCLVFVDKQYVAMMLADYFTQPNTAPRGMVADFMIGIARSTSLAHISQRQRMMKLDNFKYGETNCLFATSVAEEGLDIPACDLVIRFDMCVSAIQYIQSRGRARKSSSVFVTMLEKDNYQHMNRLQNVTLDAQSLRRFCQNLPADRRIGQYERPPERELIVADTATLSHQNSMSVLARFVSTLVQSTDKNPVPEYVVSGAGESFICWVILPDSSPFKSTSGSMERSKIRARCAAAYEACTRLIQIGSINQNLQPTFKKKLPRMRNARLALNGKNQKDYTLLIKPKMWTSLPTETPTRLFRTIVQIHPDSAGITSIALLTRQQLPDIDPIKLFASIDLTMTANLIRSGPVEISPEQVQKLAAFTRCLFDQVFSKMFDAKDEEIPYFFAPASLKLYEYEQETLDWQRIEQAVMFMDQGVAVDPGDVNRQQFVTDPHDGSRKFFIYETDRTLRATDPTPAGVPGHKNNAYLASDKSIMQYSCSTRSPHRQKIVFDTEQPVYRALLLSLRRNFLDDDRTETTKTDQICFITLQCLKLSPIPADVARAALFLPSILYRLDCALVVAEVREMLGLNIPLGLMLEAFTKNAVDPDDGELNAEHEEHGGQRNYERLEFLGDTFLKMGTTIALFTRYPGSNEFEHHVDRMVMVCNKNLFKTAIDLGLPSYIRSDTFDRRTWYPNLRLVRGKPAKDSVVRPLGDKTVADVCEAIIGAAYMGGLADGGSMDEAVRAVTKVVSSENHEMRCFADYYAGFTVPAWQAASASVSASVLVTVDRVAGLIGYAFRSPLLLRSAFTHASYTSEDIPNYQTLEFLGDALLDMAVVDHLFRTHPDAGPQFLTERKMGVCGNQFLGYLCVELGLHRELLTADAAVPGQVRAYEERLAFHHSRAEAEAVALGRPVSKGWWTPATRPPKVLADIVEALIGAMFVDARYDYNVVRSFFERFVRPHLDDMEGYDALGAGHVVTQAVHALQGRFGCARWRFCVSEVPCESRAGLAALTGSDAVCALLVHGEVRWHAKAGNTIEAKSKVASMALAVLHGINEDTYRTEMNCDCVVRRE
ncbi:RNase3 domain protein [Cordyceps fumosorosea ARSEF 2679]|uniref:Dicer-like protein 1 n=1 Tax=Cordyceps fumosorosea (strain ARSEF 2679) TaxID=1081104 RepID=A0A167R4R6_CORFA|nr:RNase3 domain protein [Cordyceps fumosorosea ARSEF 2679]OAA58270.1 RNase3 domain protein [Cordyceps fumosorosea ARSEF 2679]